MKKEKVIIYNPFQVLKELQKEIKKDKKKRATHTNTTRRGGDME